MSKNIIIQEGGTAKQMTVNKLKTDKVGGGTCLWVPEEEVSLGTKSITANGTYTAISDGKYGYSQVTVNVPGGSGCADSSGNPISSGGEPTIGSSVIGIDPSDGETYQYSVDSQGGVTKTPVLDVDPSGAGSSIIGTDPNDGKMYEYSVDSQGDVTKTLVPTITPGGAGSGVVGTDPEDGNEYFIGIDSGGNIVKTKVPSGIEIGKAPDKTTYTESETIDYSGIIVILTGGDSAMFSNTDYPNGRIPFNELTFPLKAVPSAQETKIGEFTPSTPYTLSRSDWNYPFPYGNGGGTIEQDDRSYDSSYWWTYNVPSGYIFGDGIIGFAVVTDDPTSITVADSGRFDPTFNIQIRDYSAAINGNTYYVHKMFNRVIGSDGLSLPVYGQSFSLSTVGIDLDLINLFFNNSSMSGGSAQIPVKWRSRYDGRTFEDTFEITVTGGSSGTTGDTSSGSGYSDDSGGSSSGGGTSF